MNVKVMFLLGVALVVAMVVGANMLLPPSPASSTGADAYQTPSMIVCNGYFEVEKGISGLYPKQFGTVVKVVDENQKVNEGDVLLQVYDGMAQFKAKQAAVLVTIAEKQVAEVKSLPKVYELQVEQQKSMVASIDKEIEKLEKEKARQLDLLRSDDPNKSKIKTVTEIYDLGIAQLSEKRKSEDAKLKQISLQDAQLKVDQADADLRLKKLQHEEALEAVNQFKVVAPSKGTVMRVHVRVGEMLGPNPRSVAIDFLPDAKYIVRAEVLQEWGRFVQAGQEVIIEDDTYQGLNWKGTVKSVSDWYAAIRSPVIEPFRYNDVRTLECIIEVPDASKAKYGQRVRAKIKI